MRAVTDGNDLPIHGNRSDAGRFLPRVTLKLSRADVLELTAGRYLFVALHAYKGTVKATRLPALPAELARASA